MEPRIQFAKTEDGVNIAYWMLGEGTPMLMTPGGPNSRSLQTWEIPEGRAFLEKLARDRLLIRYDHRGAGDSEHDLSEVSFEEYVADIEAVADKLNLGTFALFGGGFCSHFAIGYAVRHPERISKLILWQASAYGADLINLNRLRKARESANQDPEFYLQILAMEMFGWTGSERAKSWVSDMQRKGMLPRLQMVLDMVIETDVSDLVAQLTTPTLILHRRDAPRPSLDAARSLTARIPHGHLVVIEGQASIPYIGDADSVISAINEFLADGQEATAPQPAGTDEVAAVHTILFTDMESSTALTEKLGDAGAQEVRRAHNDIVRAALTANGGSEIKHTGDGIMASFATASAALECAIAIQRGVAAHKEANVDSPLGVYVGLNAGEPIAEENDLFGTSINLAARICDHAEAGQILASNVVRELAAGKAFLFADLGETELRGFEDPVKLWELRWEEQA